MEEISKNILHNITFILGLIGIAIILLGTLDGLIIYIKDRRNFQKIRYVIGKHILLGLDFLVVKDIIETVLLKGTEVHVMDLALLITIVAIRIALTSHTSKGIQEMYAEMEKAKRHSNKIDKELNNLSKEEIELEQQIGELKSSDIRSAKKRKELEKKIENISKLLKKKEQKKKRKE